MTHEADSSAFAYGYVSMESINQGMESVFLYIANKYYRAIQ